jgi:hypothetical protein
VTPSDRTVTSLRLEDLTQDLSVSLCQLPSDARNKQNCWVKLLSAWTCWGGLSTVPMNDNSSMIKVRIRILLTFKCARDEVIILPDLPVEQKLPLLFLHVKVARSLTARDSTIRR